MNVAAVLTLFATLGVAPTVPVKNTRGMLIGIEKSMDNQIQRISVEDPFFLLGPTRGMYIPGFGAVFSSEVNLVANAAVTPFRPPFTKEEIVKLREKKAQRAVLLKQHMRDMLLNAAWALETVPPDDSVVLGISIYYFSWEDSTGLPRQIVMKAQRKALITAPRTNTAAIESAIHTEEF